MTDSDLDNRRVRFAVVGQGHFAQTAILPAFANADNCELVALFSNDATKLRELKETYGVKSALPYEEYDAFLRSGAVDAVYIALPNDMHCDYTVRAAAARVHVLCEKPMAVTSAECEQMIAACDEARVKLMIAYRLHFEQGNLSTIELLDSGQLGDPRYFVSAFSQQVSGGIRISAERGGGPVYDIGVYCINAARYLFRAEPIDVMAVATTKKSDERFREVEEQMGVVMTFPEDRLATFSCGFGAAKESFYDVVCTQGKIRMDPAYQHSSDLRREVTDAHGETYAETFAERDQVAPELVYFADCVLRDHVPEPSGKEGLADIRVVEAIYESARTRTRVPVAAVERERRPTEEQEQTRPPPEKPETVHVEPPSR